MNTDRDTARIFRSWLRTDEHDSADRVLDHVLAVLDATPQHRPWWPVRRIADMNLFAKLATAAALVLVRPEPRPDDARGVSIGGHRAASRTAGRVSASSAARSPRIA
jgi:hypothetical protein